MLVVARRKAEDDHVPDGIGHVPVGFPDVLVGGYVHAPHAVLGEAIARV